MVGAPSCWSPVGTVILVNWLVDSKAEGLFKNGPFNCGHNQVSLPDKNRCFAHRQDRNTP